MGRVLLCLLSGACRRHVRCEEQAIFVALKIRRSIILFRSLRRLLVFWLKIRIFDG